MALSGGMVSSCHWGCGAVAARALQGEEEKGEGGGWAQQESLRGRRKLAGRRKSSGRGRRLQGPGEPQWRNRAQRRLRTRLSPAEGSRHQNSAPVTSPPPPPYVPLHGVPRYRGAQEFGSQGAEELADGCDTAINRGIEGTTFLPHHFTQPLAFPSPSTTFFCILPHHATRGDQRHFRGRFRSHPRTSGCT